jgi:hypothetical protein
LSTREACAGHSILELRDNYTSGEWEAMSFFRMGEERSLDTSSIFAIYTLTGNERMLQHLIQTILPDIDAASMFIPQKVVYKRVQGKRRKEVRDLFPATSSCDAVIPSRYSSS